LIYVADNRHYTPTPSGSGSYISTGGQDLGDNFVFDQGMLNNYQLYAGPNASGDVMDFTGAVLSSDLVSPIPNRCYYNFSFPKKGTRLPFGILSQIAWDLKSGFDEPALPKANLYLSKDNGSNYQPLARDLTDKTYSNLFNVSDATNKAKLRIDHYDSNGNMYSSCLSDTFSIGSSTEPVGYSGIPRILDWSLALGALLTSLLSSLLTAVVSIPFLQRLANAPLALFAPPAWAGKKPSWGFVYDSISKRPLKDVVLRIFTEPSGRLKSSVRSNVNGGFGFILPPGKYSLVAYLMGYAFPSKLIIGNTDGKFLSVYKGGSLDVAGDGQQKAQVNINVPLDRATMNSFDVIRVRTLATISRFFRAIRLPLMILGTIAATCLLVKDHGTVDYIIGALYVVLWVVEIKNMLKKRAYGMVRDTAGNPLSMALIRVLDSRGRLKFTAATGEDGKFQLFLDPGVYRLDVSRGGYRSIRTELFKIDKIQDVGRLDLRLQKL
jgi:hypothetical protein